MRNKKVPLDKTRGTFLLSNISCHEVVQLWTTVC